MLQCVRAGKLEAGIEPAPPPVTIRRAVPTLQLPPLILSPKQAVAQNPPQRPSSARSGQVTSTFEFGLHASLIACLLYACHMAWRVETLNDTVDRKFDTLRRAREVLQ